VLCNRYGLAIAARSLGEFQEVSEAPVSMAILTEGATPKFAQRTAARMVELKMARRLRCVSVTGLFASNNDRDVILLTTHQFK